MQNAVSVSEELHELASLAGEGSTADRSHLFVSVARLLEASGERANAVERRLMRDILRRLIAQVEMKVRMALAERLAEQAGAPHELILLLANDRIEVARFVLERSGALTENDLLAVIRDTTIGHQKVVAGRPDVTEKLAAALAESVDDGVIETLLRNAAAQIANETLELLTARASGNAALQEPLLRRPNLSKEFAEKLFGSVSESLKGFILSHFDIDPKTLSIDLDAATKAAQSDEPEPLPAQRLIDKLAAAGELKPAFLLKAISQGQRDLFERGFAKLLGLNVESTHALLYGNKPYFLAMSCKALGIDKAVFLTILGFARARSGGSTALSPHDKAEVDRVFKDTNAETALEKVRLNAVA